MRIKLSSLNAQLNQGVRPLYLLFGAEILLVEEALDQIRAYAKDNGFTERIRHTVESGFDWTLLHEQSQSMSVFAEKRLIEIRLPTGKPGDKGGKALIHFSQNLSVDTTLVIISGAIDKRSQSTKWFKALEENGLAVECPDIPTDRLPDWISQRMGTKGLKHDVDAVNFLSQLVEGNLLAAAQEINLLALLYPNETITTDVVRNTIADHARFNVYGLVDACLGGSANRVTRILQSLKRDQTEPVVILWALARDSRIMCQLSEARDSGEHPQSLFRRFGIWSSRNALVNAALKRLSRRQWQNILRRIGRADLMVKGRTPLQRKDIWEEIESISMAICGISI